MRLNLAIVFSIAIAISSTSHGKDILLTSVESGLDTRAIKAIKKGANPDISLRVKTLGSLDKNPEVMNINEGDRLIALGISPNVLSKLLSNNDGPPEKVVFGAFSTSSQVPGVSLLVNPDAVFDSLTSISKDITTLETVVSERYDKKHLKALSDSAKSRGIELKVEFAASPTDMASAWANIFNSIESTTSGVALIDTTYMSKIGGLRYILKTAWNKRTLVVTTVQPYTARGVSIGIALNLTDYGRELASELDADNKQSVFTKSYSPAINVRHLKHVGIPVKTMNLDIPVVFIE